jgi:hypothetical protein
MTGNQIAFESATILLELSLGNVLVRGLQTVVLDDGLGLFLVTLDQPQGTLIRFGSSLPVLLFPLFVGLGSYDVARISKTL